MLAALIPAFDVRVSDADEPLTGRPVSDARGLAEAKARAVERRPGEIVLAADTVVARENESYGKPADEVDAGRMLRELAGRRHMVVTGVAIATDQGMVTDHSVAMVDVRAMTDDEITAYVASGRPLDKAGAYAIQDEDVRVVERLGGCYCNVMGLPLWRTKALLGRAGVACGDPGDTYERCGACPERSG